eukprot:CAMPEP_0198111778 /NCGR_PEP_ID=MMETSP1442-20131203/3703_1 /TAXON_ID= /ORGANISM="Craspedostauros australis, Strain CCMP3328" /LENGTH=420 /DNA_ID=CAMNT_0043768345 /DNA_START=17 /DNA_END=1279 /DNA_ORIENTATION=+
MGTVDILSLSWWLGVIDLAYCVLVRLPCVSLPKFFKDGWDDTDYALKESDAFYKRLADAKISVKPDDGSSADDKGALYPGMKDKIEWDKASKKKLSNDAISVQLGKFMSPMQHALPKGTRQCRFYYVKPTALTLDNLKANKPSHEVVVIMMPATGEAGKTERLAMANRLARDHGWSSVIITAPFYAARKPKDQKLFFINNVKDFFLQTIAIVNEASALAWYFYSEGKSNSRRICVTGFSWGAAMSSLVSITCMLAGIPGQHIACIPYVGSGTPAVLPDGLLQRSIDWDALHDNDKHKSLTRQELKAATLDVFLKFDLDIMANILSDHRKQLLEVEGASLDQVDSRLSLGALRMISGQHDHIITRKYSEPFVEILEKGAVSTKTVAFPVQWLLGGHVTAALAKHWYQIPAIVDAGKAICHD